MRGPTILLCCTAILHIAGCQGMGFGVPVPSVGISQNQQDALLALLAPNHHQSGPGSSNHQSNTQSSSIGHSGIDMQSLIGMISGGATGSPGQSFTNHGQTSHVQSNFHDPSQSSSQSGTGFHKQRQSGNQGGSAPQQPQNNFYDPTGQSSASSSSNQQGAVYDPTGQSSNRNSQNGFNDPTWSTVPQASGNRHNGPSHNSQTQDPMIAALERAQTQPSNSGMNQGNLPGNALPEMFGSHPLSGKNSGNSVFGSALINSQSSGHPTAPNPQPMLHRKPASSILGSRSSNNSSAGGYLPSGAVAPGSSAPKPFRPPSVFQMKMQARMYNMKAAKLAPIMQLYEQEGCVNPIPFLPNNILEGAKSAFSNGCEDPHTKNYCSMAQLKTPGFTSARMNTQILLQSMLSPESKTQLGSMLSRMSPSNMVGGGMGGMGGMMGGMAGLMGGMGGMMGGLGGGEMGNAEIMDRVMQIRQKLFPLECNEVALTPMFKIGTCCYGKVQIPESYIMSQFLSRSFGAK